ncbi:MAG: TolC family protein, partial [Polyangia bacterium]
METFVLLSLLAVTGAAAPPGRVLTLDEALRTAIAHQPQLRQARANTEVASARADESRAALLPQVSGNASYERTTSNFVLRPSSLPTSVATMKTPGPTFDTFNFWSFGLQLNQLVWDFQSVDRWKSSKATAVAQRDVEKTTTLQVETQVRTTYFTARAQKALVVVAQETLANQQKHMVQISGFVRVGTRPEIDLATAKTNVANAEVQLINAENAYETAKAQLNLAIGVAGPTDYDVADETLPPVDGEDLTTDALYDEALKARPEVATLTEQVRA